MINALYKVPRKKMRRLMAAIGRACRRSNRICWEVAGDGGAPPHLVIALDVDHGRNSYSDGVTWRPSPVLTPDSATHTHTPLPSLEELTAFIPYLHFTSLLTTDFVGLFSPSFQFVGRLSL